MNLYVSLQKKFEGFELSAEFSTASDRVSASTAALATQ
jgi:hypothetical protein